MIYWTVRNHDVVDGVPLCEPFLELPSKSYYPDYYDEIKKPMSLFMINKRIKRGEYQGIDNLVQDMCLMFENAKSYNIETSDIYKAAATLERMVRKKARELQKDRKSSPKSTKQEVRLSVLSSYSTLDSKRRFHGLWERWVAVGEQPDARFDQFGSKRNIGEAAEEAILQRTTRRHRVGYQQPYRAKETGEESARSKRAEDEAGAEVVRRASTFLQR